MKLPEERDLPPSINMLPTIDVIFAILVFFIVSSLYLTRSEGLPVNLPQAKTTELQQNKQITVSLDSDEILTVDGKTVELDQLQNRVTNLVKSESTALVIVNADQAIAHGKVVDIIDRLREIPEVKIAIAAKKKVNN